MKINLRNPCAQPAYSGSNTKIDHSAMTPRPQKRVFLQARYAA